MILTLPRANVTHDNPYVRFVVDNSELIRTAAAEAMQARFEYGIETVMQSHIATVTVRCASDRVSPVSHSG
jgi:hypothetical protein